MVRNKSLVLIFAVLGLSCSLWQCCCCVRTDDKAQRKGIEEQLKDLKSRWEAVKKKKVVRLLVPTTHKVLEQAKENNEALNCLKAVERAIPP
jgi:hypothetical protein